jgi:hypothetical protein
MLLGGNVCQMVGDFIIRNGAFFSFPTEFVSVHLL